MNYADAVSRPDRLGGPGKHMSKRNLIWLAIIMVMAVGFYQLTTMSAQQDTVFRTYAPLIEVDALIRKNFVEPIDENHLLDGAIRGMMLKLDPYSGYIGPEELDAFRRRMSGEYTGIGVQLGVRNGELTIIAPIEESPAMQAGIKAGDVVLAINDTPVEGMGVADADRLLEGSSGSDVRLTVRHAVADHRDDVEELVITRGPIRLRSIKGIQHRPDGTWEHMLPGELPIAYIRVSSFHENTMAELDECLDRIRSSGAQGLVIDLRFNPGGLMSAAISLVDRFLREGEIVSTVTRHQATVKAIDTYLAQPEGTFPALPMAVLINEHSASAAEIVAGALQDHQRAVVYGERSFGKGVIQNVVDLKGHRAAISLTVAHYRLPSGRIIHKSPANSDSGQWGVIPDVVVELDAQQELAVQDRRILADQPQPLPETMPSDPADLQAEPDHSILIDEQLQAAWDSVRNQIELGDQTDRPPTVSAIP
jgi:carboxyl-terminal processing protease